MKSTLKNRIILYFCAALTVLVIVQGVAFFCTENLLVYVGVSLAASILLVLLLSVLISRSLFAPLNKLVASFKEIAAGQATVQLEKTDSEELNALSQTAGYMLERIGELTNNLLRQQRQYADEQLKALQNQINPHFLNNTLQALKSFAVTGDMDAVSKMTTMLGKLLSYSVYEPFGMVRLEEELRYTETYIALQKIRYPQISFFIDADESALNAMVPKLVIQPLVENAIEHGLSTRKDGIIKIIAEADEREIHIIVMDNGGGFTPDKLGEINALLADGNPYGAKQSIGLLNVCQRIRNTYGQQYGVSILFRAGMNTSAIITIPRLDKEEEDSAA